MIEARFEMRSFARSGDTRTGGISAEPLAADVPALLLAVDILHG